MSRPCQIPSAFTDVVRPPGVPFRVGARQRLPFRRQPFDKLRGARVAVECRGAAKTDTLSQAVNGCNGFLSLSDAPPFERPGKATQSTMPEVA